MYSRRQFLFRTVWLFALPRAIGTLATQGTERGTEMGLTATELHVLGTAMDEIIPAGDGMPSATAAGGLQYLQYLGWQYSNIEQEISRFIKALEQDSLAQFGADFTKLQSDQGVQLLATVEREQKPSFSTFVGYVYESYYTRPRVLGLISCAVPALPAEDDEELLAPVRKLTHLYREVP